MNQSSLKKFLRTLRAQNDEIMADMAVKLNYSPAFLSKIENGRTKPPKDFEQKMRASYKLSLEEEKELRESVLEAQNQKEFPSMPNMPDDDFEMVIALARRIKDMSSSEKDDIRNIIYKKKE